jgi:phosphoribosylanthranilate isomerase
MTTAVKICGMGRVDDALAAARAGAHAIGLVFYKPSPRYVTPEQARDIIRALPPFVTPVGLFVDATEEEVRKTIAVAPVALLQFHGAEKAAFCRKFGLPYIKAIRVQPGTDLLQYARDFHDAKALLLDAFVAGTHGGTGQSFDWSLVPRDYPCRSFFRVDSTPQTWPAPSGKCGHGRLTCRAAWRRPRASRTQSGSLRL